MRLRHAEIVLGGVRRTWVDDDGTVVDQLISDVTPVIDQNKRHATGDHSPIAPWLGDKVACIPLVIAEKWLNDHGVDVFQREHWPRVRQLLNDPDWRYLRTTDKVI
jgi:hypothetical protein